MLLAIDIGNSNIVLGLFKSGVLVKEFRIETEKEKRQEWYLPFIKKFADKETMDVAIASVVPELDDSFITICMKLFKKEPLFVSTLLKTNVVNLSKKPTQLGADRLSGVSAAISLTTGNRIVVDIGTATKFEVVSEKNEYLGGAIAPGVQVSFDALIKNASKLDSIKLVKPKKAIGGFTTEEHLMSGFINGFASMIDGMIERIIDEAKFSNQTVFLTGGFTDMIYPFLRKKVTADKTLTLKGIAVIQEMNRQSIGIRG